MPTTPTTGYALALTLVALSACGQGRDGPGQGRDGMPFYACEGCPAAESPVFFDVADGVVRRIRFTYYVD